MKAFRPIFLPGSKEENYCKEVMVEFPWIRGLSPSQKRERSGKLKMAGREKLGVYPILEVSTSSTNVLGLSLSAFRLQRKIGDKWCYLESLYQGSKVFEGGGPYQDLYGKLPWEAKKDPRLYQSGKLVGFEFFEEEFPLEPNTYFYNWLYLSSLARAEREKVFVLFDSLSEFQGFCDIEFNPGRGINCQARCVAIFVGAYREGVFEEMMNGRETFLNILYPKDK